MPYIAEISRGNPSCFLFLIDQSGSMRDPFGADPSKRKADGVADAINRLLQNLAIKCAKSEGVRDYYHVGVLGYGHRPGPAFGGVLSGRELVPISEVAGNPARVDERVRKVEDGAGGLVDQTVKFPIWFDPVANGGTPMCQALARAQKIVQGFIAEHPDCFPPIVINITDGEATDGDPSVPAQALMNTASTDGNVLLFNLHLSSQNASPIEFPDSDENLPTTTRLLFGMSSGSPITCAEWLKKRFKASENTRGFVFNADIVSVIRFWISGPVRAIYGRGGQRR